MMVPSACVHNVSRSQKSENNRIRLEFDGVAVIALPLQKQYHIDQYTMQARVVCMRQRSSIYTWRP